MGFSLFKKRQSDGKKNVLKLGLKISFITYISGPNGVLRKKTHISLIISRYIFFYELQITPQPLDHYLPMIGSTPQPLDYYHPMIRSPPNHWIITLPQG